MTSSSSCFHFVHHEKCSNHNKCCSIHIKGNCNSRKEWHFVVNEGRKCGEREPFRRYKNFGIINRGFRTLHWVVTQSPSHYFLHACLSKIIAPMKFWSLKLISLLKKENEDKQDLSQEHLLSLVRAWSLRHTVSRSGQHKPTRERTYTHHVQRK